jgi:hypothetical protein
MKRYEAYNANLEQRSDGRLSLYSDAMEEVNNRDRQIDLLKGELELSKQEVYSKNQIIAQLNPCGHTGFESVSCDVCGYPDSRKLIAKLKAKVAGLSDSVGEYSLEEKDLRKELSRLTAMIESEDAAEKVANSGIQKFKFQCSDCSRRFRRAINDYRTMLMKEIEK